VTTVARLHGIVDVMRRCLLATVLVAGCSGATNTEPEIDTDPSVCNSLTVVRGVLVDPNGSTRYGFATARASYASATDGSAMLCIDNTTDEFCFLFQLGAPGPPPIGTYSNPTAFIDLFMAPQPLAASDSEVIVDAEPCPSFTGRFRITFDSLGTLAGRFAPP
jgi:hypothetical protein